MPYDSGGNFFLVPSYLATAGQTIRTEQHNPPLEDIASGLSQVLVRDGRNGMVGNLRMGGYRVRNMLDGEIDTDAATVGQVGYFQHLPEAVKTDNYTITTADIGRVIVANKATDITFALPSLASMGGAPLFIRNIGVGNLTLDGDGSEQIEGAVTFVMRNGEAALVYPGASSWRAFRFIRQMTTVNNTVPRFVGTTGALQTSTLVINDDGSIKQTSTGAETIPSGTTEQRPETPSAAMLRFNSTLGWLEIYSGSAWIPLIPNGVGQTWQNLTGSRARNTVYQNTTARPIQVAVNFGSSGSANMYFEVSVDAVAWVTVGYFTYNATSGGSSTHLRAGGGPFTIPPNWRYRVRTTGSSNIDLESWAELR